MIYIRVTWKHDHPDEPVLLYSELDAERWEVRKVEVFRRGRKGYADANIEAGGTGLGTMTVPELAEIAKDPQFEPVQITKEEFEAMWSSATSGQRSRGGMRRGPGELKPCAPSRTSLMVRCCRQLPDSSCL